MIGFTPLESAVAACLLDGLRDKETARACGISTRMARKHVTRLRVRFDCESRDGLRQILRWYA